MPKIEDVLECRRFCSSVTSFPPPSLVQYLWHRGNIYGTVQCTVYKGTEKHSGTKQLTELGQQKLTELGQQKLKELQQVGRNQKTQVYRNYKNRSAETNRTRSIETNRTRPTETTLFEKLFLPTASVKMFRNLSLTCLGQIPKKMSP